MQHPQCMLYQGKECKDILGILCPPLSISLTLNPIRPLISSCLPKRRREYCINYFYHPCDKMSHCISIRYGTLIPAHNFRGYQSVIIGLVQQGSRALSVKDLCLHWKQIFTLKTNPQRSTFQGKSLTQRLNNLLKQCHQLTSGCWIIWNLWRHWSLVNYEHFSTVDKKTKFWLLCISHYYTANYES